MELIDQRPGVSYGMKIDLQPDLTLGKRELIVIGNVVKDKHIQIRMLKHNKAQVVALETFGIKRHGQSFQVPKGNKFSVIYHGDTIFFDKEEKVSFWEKRQNSTTEDSLFDQFIPDENDNNLNTSCEDQAPRKNNARKRSSNSKIEAPVTKVSKPTNTTTTTNATKPQSETNESIAQVSKPTKATTTNTATSSNESIENVSNHRETELAAALKEAIAALKSKTQKTKKQSKNSSSSCSSSSCSSENEDSENEKNEEEPEHKGNRPRQRCPEPITCKKKLNRKHTKLFCHPYDPDWSPFFDDSARAKKKSVYGRNCGRRSKSHFKKYHHHDVQIKKEHQIQQSQPREKSPCIPHWTNSK